jgi:hypothetical protein
MFGKRLAQRGHREKNFATACQRENGGDAFGMNVGMRTYCFVITALMLLVTSAAAQLPPPTIVPPLPTLNPSSSLILPQPPPLPVSPAPGGSPHQSQLSSLQPYPRPCSVFSGHPCNPSFCSVFHHGPCFPYYLPPLGQDLRLTIVSTDEDDSLVENGRDGREHALSSIRDMFAALRACWVPPPKPQARHGMEYTIRFALKRDGTLIAPPRMTYPSHDVPAAMRDIYRTAIDTALNRCTPLYFSMGMAEAVAGRPIAIRFVDERTIDN